MVEELVYGDLSYTLIGICFDVRNSLKKYVSKEEYMIVVEEELKKRGLSYSKTRWSDFVVEDKIVLGLKNKKGLTDKDCFQTLNYLKKSKKQLGILVNFKNYYLTPKRILNNFN